jgi:hypothetical protein
VPDDDPPTVRGGQNVLFGFRKAGGVRGRAYRLRYRKEERPLHEKHCNETAEIADRQDNDEPFQVGHDVS